MEPELSRSADRELQFQEILVRYVDAVESGHTPDPKEFTARYPEFAAELEEYFAGLRQLDQMASPLRELVQPPVARQLGDFRLLREVGRGGMGIVYEAEQLSLDRRVALKVLPFAAMLDSKQLRRFKNEAQAAAHLHHPNIVPVYAVGFERGVHYFAMQFIEGQSLDALLRELRLREGLAAADGGPVAGEDPPGNVAPRTETTQPRAVLSTERSGPDRAHFRMVAELGTQAALALEHAHEQGIIHRDIKPANLLVDQGGHLWITDFGLARSQSDLTLTLTGDLVGTLRYMSPEQALARRGVLDQRTDIYSLGVTLYELLTLQPAFSGNDRQELLRRIAWDEPVPPSRLRRAVPADLETIILKAIAKEVEGRYAGAQELADDLQRFLSDRPVLAKRPTLAHRLRKWLGRHKAFTAGAAALLLLATVCLAISTALIWSKEQKTQQALADARASERVADEQRILAEKREQLARRYLYAADLNLAYQAWDTRQVARALQLLERQRPEPGREDLRGFEWHHLRNRCSQGRYRILRGHTGPVTALACAADGTHVASGGEDGAAWLWDTASGQGRALLPASQDKISSVAFAADRRTLAIGRANGTLILWDLIRDREKATIHCRGGLLAAAFSGDATKLAAAGAYGIEIWDAASAKLLAVLQDLKHGVYSAAFSPDGKMLASGSNDGKVRLWKSPFGGQPAILGGHHAYVLALDFSRDGRSLASAADDGSVSLWDLASGQGRPADNLHTGSAHGVAFFPDGKRLVSCGEDGTIQLSRIGSRDCDVRGEVDEIYSVALSFDGQMIATGQADGGIGLWHIADMESEHDVLRHGRSLTCAALARDGRTVASADQLGAIKLWDSANQKTTASWQASRSALHGICFSPDGQLLATVAEDAAIQIWSVAERRLLRVLTGHTGQAWCAAFSPDGRTLATAGYSDHVVKLWQVDSGQCLGTLRGHTDSVWSVAFAPDGHSLASGSRDSTARIWNVADLRPLAVLSAHKGWVWAVEFSLDGQLLATASQDRTVGLWQTGTWQRRATLQGHATFVRALAFFPDGKTLATGSDDQTVKIWDLDTGQERATLRGHAGTVSSLAVSASGQLLISGSWDGTVRLWRAAEPNLRDASADESP